MARCQTSLSHPINWQVHNLTIRAKGKVLLENTTLTIAAGRRYGLVGPNGKGKSTLLRMIARRQIPVSATARAQRCAGLFAACGGALLIGWREASKQAVLLCSLHAFGWQVGWQVGRQAHAGHAAGEAGGCAHTLLFAEPALACSFLAPQVPGTLDVLLVEQNFVGSLLDPTLSKFASPAFSHFAGPRYPGRAAGGAGDCGQREDCPGGGGGR